jgi:hypothetical protein
LNGQLKHGYNWQIITNKKGTGAWMSIIVYGHLSKQPESTY